ncbi:MAG: DNA repair protein RecO [Burkholderiales bacterium]|nr:DNA repair protein RecO [Burkholderiales bacterium]
MAVQAKKSHPQRAFVLHSYAYSESSVIVDLFTLDNGRMAAIAKGAKRPASNLRGALLSLQPLEVIFSGRGEVKTLTQAQWLPGQPWLTGRALMCGMYLNELIIKLLPREDPHPELFERYAAALLTLAASDEHSAILREFETSLLAEMGYGLQLDHDVKSGQPISGDTLYRYDPLAGPSAQSHGIGPLVRGEALHALASGRFATTAVTAEARDFVRAIIQFHLERRTVRSSAVMHDLQALTERLDSRPRRSTSSTRSAPIEGISAEGSSAP